MKDHEIAQLVNDLTEIAIKFKDTQQLRSRVLGVIVPVIRKLNRKLCDKHQDVQGNGMCSVCLAEAKNKESTDLYWELDAARGILK